MEIKQFARTHWVKLLLGFLIILAIVLFSFREKITENKYTKAKMDIFKSLQDKDMEKAKMIIDSMSQELRK